jgi:hypothetical protein
MTTAASNNKSVNDIRPNNSSKDNVDAISFHLLRPPKQELKEVQDELLGPESGSDDENRLVEQKILCFFDHLPRTFIFFITKCNIHKIFLRSCFVNVFKDFPGKILLLLLFFRLHLVVQNSPSNEIKDLARISNQKRKSIVAGLTDHETSTKPKRQKVPPNRFQCWKCLEWTDSKESLANHSCLQKIRLVFELLLNAVCSNCKTLAKFKRNIMIDWRNFSYKIMNTRFTIF